MQSSVLTRGEEGRQGSQEQSEVDHGDFEMVVSKVLFLLVDTKTQVWASDSQQLCVVYLPVGVNGLGDGRKC